MIVLKLPAIQIFPLLFVAIPTDSLVEKVPPPCTAPVSYTHLRDHEPVLDLVCRLLLEKKKHNTRKKCTTSKHTEHIAETQVTNQSTERHTNHTVRLYLVQELHT